MNKLEENPQLSTETSKYAVLHGRGVTLSDEGIDFVINHLDEGVHHMMDYVGDQQTDHWPHYVSNDDGLSIGYILECVIDKRSEWGGVTTSLTLQMDLPYLKFYGLIEEPFSTVPSPRYVFLTEVHSTALEKTSYVVGARKGLAAVFGDTGTGKSSLARLLHQKFLDQGFISVLLTNPNYPTPNSLLRTIVQEFGTGRSDRSFKGLLDIFKSFLIEQALEQDKTVVLIIDEAQTMGFPLLELLHQLMNVESNSQKLLQVVLRADGLPPTEPKGGAFAEDGACPPGFPIKAGVDDSGSKIYYTPDTANYDLVVPVLCFQIIDGAEFDGFHPAAD